LEGIINVLKPPGMTSSDVVGWVRKRLHTKKVGHTGTLDPGVTGVLPICVGQATRLAEFLTAQGKAYRAEITFGVTTDTQDAFGQVTELKTPDINIRDLNKVIKSFEGAISQCPPMFSAVRKNGKHLYEYARQGIEVARSEREVIISKLTVERWIEGEYPRAILNIECSKGTYIRTLCHDIGRELGCGAHMSHLVRLRSGPFRLEDSWTLEAIEEEIGRESYSFLLPLTTGLDLPLVLLAPERVKAFRQGLSTSEQQVVASPGVEGQIVQVWSEEQCLGIARWRDGELLPSKVFK